MQPSSNGKITRAIPHEALWFVAGINNKATKKMVLSNYLRAYFANNEVELELVDVSIKNMTATLIKKGEG